MNIFDYREEHIPHSPDTQCAQLSLTSNNGDIAELAVLGRDGALASIEMPERQLHLLYAAIRMHLIKSAEE
jgi:hypothetical protein